MPARSSTACPTRATPARPRPRRRRTAARAPRRPRRRRAPRRSATSRGRSLIRTARPAGSSKTVTVNRSVAQATPSACARSPRRPRTASRTRDGSLRSPPAGLSAAGQGNPQGRCGAVPPRCQTLRLSCMRRAPAREADLELRRPFSTGRATAGGRHPPGPIEAGRNGTEMATMATTDRSG